MPIILPYPLLTKRRDRRRVRGRPRPDDGRAGGGSLSPHRRRLRPLKLALLAGGCEESGVPHRGPQSCLPTTQYVHPSSVPATCPLPPTTISLSQREKPRPEIGFLAMVASLHRTSILGTHVGAGVGRDHECNLEPNVSTCRTWLLGPVRSHRDCDWDFDLPMASLA